MEDSSMQLKNIDLIGAILVVAINVEWTQLPSRPLIIGIILALPLIFVLPGYTLTQTLFRKRPPEPSSNLILQPSLKIGQPVSAVDHIILSLGLSMAIDVLIGFMLNVFPIGLQALSWTISLGLVTTVFAMIAGWLRRRDFVKIASVKMERIRPRITIYECILFGLAILVATAAVWFSVIRPPATQSNFTQFWMLPSNQANNSCAVSIGVHSFESTSITYRIVLMINSIQVNTWSSIVLVPQEEWTRSAPIKLGATGDMYIEAQLDREDIPNSVYRDVHLTLHSVKGSKNGYAQQCTT
jgi:uncharacterized membrane protein